MGSFNFLALSGELRNMIYRYTLTSDPPVLDRQHKYYCKKCPLKPQPHRKTEPVYEAGERIPGCKCGVRTGLGLLLANRQIYWEGASIFWAENHFTFWDTESFIQLVGSRLQRRWRNTLRGISVLNDCPYTSPRSNSTRDRFSRVLFQCQNLRNLEVARDIDLGLNTRRYRPPTRNCPDMEAAVWAGFKRRLPELSTFTQTIWRETTWWWGQVIASKFLNIEAVSPEQLKVVGPFTRLDDVVTAFVAFEAAGRTRPPFPTWMQPVEDTGKLHEKRCWARHQDSEAPVLFTARRIPQPMSPETFARNKLLRRIDRLRKEADRKCRKEEGERREADRKRKETDRKRREEDRVLREARRKSSMETYGWEERLRSRHEKMTQSP